MGSCGSGLENWELRWKVAGASSKRSWVPRGELRIKALTTHHWGPAQLLLGHGREMGMELGDPVGLTPLFSSGRW